MILINGLPLFAKKLTDDLNEIQKEHTFIFLNTYYSKVDKIKFFLLAPFCKMVISFNGVSDKSGTLSWTLRLKKKLVMQWQGTDVLLANERFKGKTIYTQYIQNAIHFSDCDWLMEEMKEILPNISKLHFKYVNVNPKTKTYDAIEALTYLGEGREDFYGWKTIKELAEKNPGIPFHIVGTSKIEVEEGSNIQIHGWVDSEKMKALYEKCGVFIRLTSHDGFSLSVLDALSFGCEVLWNNPTQQTLMVKNLSEVNEVFNHVVSKIQERNLSPNTTHYSYLKENFSKKEVISNYYNNIKKILNQ